MIVNVDIISVNIQIAGKSIHGDMEEKTILRDITQRQKDKIAVVCASEGRRLSNCATNNDRLKFKKPYLLLTVYLWLFFFFNTKLLSTT